MFLLLLLLLHKLPLNIPPPLPPQGKKNKNWHKIVVF